MGKLEVKEEDFCPVCGKAKSRTLFILGTMQTFHVLCDCESRKREEDEEERKHREFMQTIAQNRSAGFAEKKMLECTFANDDGKGGRAMQICRDYAENFEKFKKADKGLLLYGTVGNGKTYMAAAIMNHLIDQGRRCLMTNLSRIINQMWEESDKNAYLDSLASYELLVIDDYAAERNTDYVNDIVFQVIDARYRSGLPLIMTTNLSEEELTRPKDIAKNRIYSRIFEMCFPIKVIGADRRTKGLRNAESQFNDIMNS